MARLFTFGCSYTYYLGCPTWSPFLGLEFDNYENWGIPGSGCRSISERVAECHARNNINADDIVIVQWTHYLRHDYCKFVKDNQYHWRAKGSIFQEGNSKIFTPWWIDTFFDESAYVMHSLNAIISVISLLKSTGCTWYMTSIGDFTKLGSDLANYQADEKINSNQISIQKDFPQYNFYIDRIWSENKDHWIKPIAYHAIENPDKNWLFKNKKGEWSISERHPSAVQHVSWLNTYLRPLLGLGDPPKEQQLWLDAIAEVKEKADHDVFTFYTNINTKGYPHKFWPDDIWFKKVPGF